MAFLNIEKKPTLLITTLGLLALAVLAGCSSNSSETNEARSKEVRCELAQVLQQEVPLTVTATGGLQADKSINISTRMMGWIKEIYVVEGQAVKKGEPLISIDDSDLKAKKAQAEAGIREAEAVLANAQRMAERFEKLYSESSVSKSQLDNVTTGRDRAQAGLEMARAGLTEVNVHLSYLDITAPVDGVIARKMVEEGNMATPGMPLITLENADVVKVIAHLGEKDITMVKAGDRVEVNVTSLSNAKYSVPLDRVIQSANAGSRTYDIEATLDNSDGGLRSGMFARVTVPVGTRQAILVPRQAIIKRGQLTGVWTVDEQNIVHLRWVRLGHDQGGQAEILSGLSGGETVVLSAQMPLAEGDKVVN